MGEITVTRVNGEISGISIGMPMLAIIICLVLVIVCGVLWMLFFRLRRKFYPATVAAEITSKKGMKKVGSDEGLAEHAPIIVKAYKIFFNYTVNGQVYNGYTKTYVDSRHIPHGFYVNYRPNNPSMYCIVFEDKERMWKGLKWIIVGVILLVALLIPIFGALA